MVKLIFGNVFLPKQNIKNLHVWIAFRSFKLRVKTPSNHFIYLKYYFDSLFPSLKSSYPKLLYDVQNAFDKHDLYTAAFLDFGGVVSRVRMDKMEIICNQIYVS